MILYSDACWEECCRILDAYTEQDPEGDFDEAEWKAFFNEHASDALKKEAMEVERVYQDARNRGARI